LRHGYKSCIWLRQSVSRYLDLILLLDAPQHRQLDFISSLSFWMKPEENPLSKIPSDDGCSAVRERPQSQRVEFIFLWFNIQ